jgi:hypothetical protein
MSCIVVKLLVSMLSHFINNLNLRKEEENVMYHKFNDIFKHLNVKNNIIKKISNFVIESLLI